MDQLYLEHRKGSRELIAWDMEVLPRDPAALLAAVDAIALDETFHDLVATVARAVGAAIEIVSDGMGFHVERMLARLGLADLPVATNATELGRRWRGRDLPLRSPGLPRLRHLQAGARAAPPGCRPRRGLRGRRPERSLRRPPRRRRLRQVVAGCLVRDAGHRLRGLGSAGDVATWLEAALGDGRLPSDAARSMRMVGGSGAQGRPFICGPEVWGPGSVTVDDAA